MLIIKWISQQIVSFQTLLSIFLAAKLLLLLVCFCINHFLRLNTFFVFNFKTQPYTPVDKSTTLSHSFLTTMPFALFNRLLSGDAPSRLFLCLIYYWMFEVVADKVRGSLDLAIMKRFARSLRPLGTRATVSPLWKSGFESSLVSCLVLMRRSAAS